MSTKEDKLDEIIEQHQVGVQEVINDAKEFRWRDWVIKKNFQARRNIAKSDLNKLFKERFLELLPKEPTADIAKLFLDKPDPINYEKKAFNRGYRKAIKAVRKAIEDKYKEDK